MKRILSLFMVFVLCVSLLPPGTALAAGNTVYLNGDAGNDNGDNAGSKEYPVKTLTKAIQLAEGGTIIIEGQAEIGPKDMDENGQMVIENVTIKRGENYEGQLLSIHSSAPPDNDPCEVTLRDVTIDGMSNANVNSEGYLINVNSYAQLIIEGETKLLNNAVTALRISNHGYAIMTGGEISGNNTSGTGAAVDIGVGSDFEMQGGSIYNNDGNYAVSVMSNPNDLASFIMSGDDATIQHSGWYAISSGSSIVKITGGTIQYDSYYHAIHLSSSTAQISGGTIAANCSISLEQKSRLELSKSPKLSGYIWWNESNNTICATEDFAPSEQVEITCDWQPNVGDIIITGLDGKAPDARNFAIWPYALKASGSNLVLAEKCDVYFEIFSPDDTYTSIAIVAPKNEPFPENWIPDCTFEGYTISGWKRIFPLPEGSWDPDDPLEGDMISVQPIWTKNQYKVNLDSSSVQGGTCEGGGTYEYNEEITVTATPAEGYHFVSWLDRDGKKVSENPYTFHVKAETTLTPLFAKNEPDHYSITASADPAEGGSVSGDTECIEDQTATVNAVPALGYRFVGWVENGQVVCTELSYTFQAEANTVLTARFEQEQYTVTAVASAAEGGSVTGSGQYTYGQEVTVTATPSEGYRFEGWMDGETPVSSNSVYTFTADGSVSLTAKFVKDAYTITLIADSPGGGSVSGYGTYDNGAVATIRADTYSGYEFSGWEEDGETVIISEISSFAVTEDRILTAKFNKEQRVTPTPVDPGDYPEIDFSSLSGYWTDGLTAQPTGYMVDGDTITITTSEGLAWLSVQVNGLNGVAADSLSKKTVRLGADINLNGKFWVPIGTYGGTSFSGSFDGQGHTISNMAIKTDGPTGAMARLGLFGQVFFTGSQEHPSYVRDVALSNTAVQASPAGSGYMGALIGHAFGGVGEISGCTASGQISIQGTAARIDCGGLVGQLNPLISGGEITLRMKECAARVDITGRAQNAGGLIGMIYGGSSVTNCGSTGDIKLISPSVNTMWGTNAGGLIGTQQGAGQMEIKSCYATGNVSITDAEAAAWKSNLSDSPQSAGGFIGSILLGSTTTIEGCMCSGDVSLTTTRSIDTPQYAGGFAGCITPADTIRNCYCTGDVLLDGGVWQYGGGFMGYSAADLTNCYALGKVVSTGTHTQPHEDSTIRALGFSAETGSNSGSYVNCYALGESVEGTEYVGGFISSMHKSGDAECYSYGGMKLLGTQSLLDQAFIKMLAIPEIADEATFTKSLSNPTWRTVSSSPLPILTDIPEQVQVTEKPYYLYMTVTFDSQGGSAVAAQRLYYGKTAPKPANPSRSGYTFGGWFTDEECTTEYNFSTPVTGNITLYAKWNAAVPDTPANPTNPIIPVTGVALNKTTLSLTEGETEQLTASVSPDNASNKNVSWTSSNPTVATVDSSGKVTAAGPGSAVITATTADGGKTAECSVTVTAKTDPPVSGHTHVWAEEWSSDNTHHWHMCTAEGCGLSGSSQMDSYGVHIYDGDMDASCNVCGYERTLIPSTPGHTHVWADQWSNNNTHHWHECTAGNCPLTGSSQKDGYTVHQYDGPLDTDCNICGHVWTVLPDPDLPAGDGKVFQLVLETGIPGVPAGLRDHEGLNTPAKLAAALTAMITQSGIPQSNTAIFDVTLMASTDGGVTWTPAAAENFPPEGLTVTLPYPAETNSSYRFTVVHMFTTSAFGKIPGTTETFTPQQVKNTPDGIQFVVTGLSPISVGWEMPSIPSAPSKPSRPSSNSSGGGVSTYAITVEKSEHGKVTSDRSNASRSSTVTLTAAPDSGYVLDTLDVTDTQGSEVRLIDKGNGKYTFTMPGSTVTVKAVFAPLPNDAEKPCTGGEDCPSYAFTDLGTVGTWYHEAVDFVLRNDLMNGYGSNLFGLDDNLSRAQLAQILYNKAGKPAVTGGSVFADVADGQWYTPAITWAAANGIVNGYGSGLFGPDDNITREQLAVVLWRYAGSPAATGQALHFTDADKTSGYALKALCWTVENGILNGYSDGSLNPGGLATRAQTAQMLMNFFCIEIQE